MPSNAFLIAVIIAAVAAPVLATEYMVGDDQGWRLNVNYTDWASGKDFRVGDKIMFMYNKDFHNVAKVNGTGFQECVQSNSSNLLRSGSDTITFAAPGRKWYICSLNDHCSRGMKLVIDVSAATTVKSYGWILAILAAVKLIMG